MIVYLSHWDWNLYKSRKDIVSNLNDINFTAVCPEGIYTKELKSIYKDFISWKIDRKKTFDFKGVINLKNILNSLKRGTIVHSFTLKTGILYSVANLFVNNKIKGVLSINGLGYLFSNNFRAKLLKLLLKTFIKKSFNKSFEEIIFLKFFTKNFISQFQT